MYINTVYTVYVYTVYVCPLVRPTKYITFSGQMDGASWLHVKKTNKSDCQKLWHYLQERSLTFQVKAWTGFKV